MLGFLIGAHTLVSISIIGCLCPVHDSILHLQFCSANLLSRPNCCTYLRQSYCLHFPPDSLLTKQVKQNLNLYDTFCQWNFLQLNLSCWLKLYKRHFSLVDLPFHPIHAFFQNIWQAMAASNNVYVEWQAFQQMSKQVFRH